MVGSLPPPPPLPLLVKERMRLEREEATRLLEEETEVRHSSSAGLQKNFKEVCADKNTKAGFYRVDISVKTDFDFLYKSVLKYTLVQVKVGERIQER